MYANLYDLLVENSLDVYLLSLIFTKPHNIEYFTYGGSLTTPPCTEAVNWKVISKPLKITSKQLEELTKHFSGSILIIKNNQIMNLLMD